MEEKKELPENKSNKGKALWKAAFLLILVLIGMVIYTVVTEAPVVVDDSTVACIVDNTELYVLATCPACREQKRILGDNIDMFNVIECLDDIDACTLAGISSVPTWIVEGESIVGIKTWDELKDMTGC